ncbi:MAG TPA: GNAT family N-acetyltransferase [Actinomycetota bacterium]|nr:GNAT family N-acetyltransferase [Actinomycetota bacterium]
MTAQAWELAHGAAAAAGVELRPLDSLDDADRIVHVLARTWGDEQVVPREMLRALAESGNVPYGAFAGDELTGYVLGWIGSGPEEALHVHSHMLATLPDRRHHGVGYALKLAQRAQALDLGIRVVRWTFDPLVARNAHLNLHKLGTTIDRFERSFYGEMRDSLNRGDRSDRFFVRWDLERVPGPRPVETAEAQPVLRRDRAGRPVREDAAGDVLLLEIPEDHTSLRTAQPELARRWRDLVAEAAEECLGRGLVGLAFFRDRGTYVFGPEETSA